MAHRPARVSVLGLSLLAAGVTAPVVSAADVDFGIEGGYFDMTNARHSAEAVFDNPGGLTLGGQLRVGLGERFFAGAHVSYFKREGERVFVADASSPPFRLGHPLTLRLIPAYAMVGYRFSPDSSLSPYVALGGGIVSYREESDVAGITESQSATKASGQALAGLEYGRGTIRFGVELAYSLVPNIVGLGGVTQVYGEDDLGGFSVVAKVVVAP